MSNAAIPPLPRKHPRLRHLADLARSGRERREAGSFLVEGPVLVGEAVDAGAEVQEVFVEAGAAASDPAIAAVLDRAAATGARIVPVVDGALAPVVDVVTPRPVAATVAIPVDRAGALGVADLVLVLVGVGDPGNVGTLIRAAEAAGAGAVACCDGTADPFAPKVVRSSAGALFHVPLVTGASATAVLDALAEAGTAALGAVVGAGTAYDSVDCTGPTALVLGSEAHGLPTDLADRLDLRVAIPMAGRSESLNVAMAGSILAFEVLRQRRAGS